MLHRERAAHSPGSGKMWIAAIEKGGSAEAPTRPNEHSLASTVWPQQVALTESASTCKVCGLTGVLRFVVSNCFSGDRSPHRVTRFKPVKLSISALPKSTHRIHALER